MKNIKLIFALFLFTQVNFAQEIKVYGVVKDNLGELMPGVNVSIEGKDKGTQTDVEGTYSLKVTLYDTLIFSLLGMKTQKIKVDKEEINVQLEANGLSNNIEIPYMPIKKIYKEYSAITIKELKTSKKKLNNPKYNFKKNAKKNVFLIFVSQLNSYDFKKEDIEFQQKFNIKYSLIGSYKIDYYTKYNKLTFKHLKKKYTKIWLTEIRKDAIGLDNFK